ncbi:ABC transporter permease [Desulfococcus multivorans]|jgi:tungstate transport system permease protein|uniref:ABC-type transporter, integral membrane subunit n=2 Tax=Desulfococcaceae TaxID=2931039 RepID=S7U687_DESML|nr:ABC transporter permease [Desulfococcus multivorans]EPR44610.1 ABC-type transporter, integral membrane subunit [Desulfococcus multivorans DSM 2059]SKA07073.1 tungstate transport system permease protein [Desulfococcus multivorans DSM 2059]
MYGGISRQGFPLQPGGFFNSELHMNFLLEGFFQAFRLLLNGNAETYSAIWATVRVSTYSMLVSLWVGVPLGFCLGYFEFQWKKSVRTVVDTLMSLPTVFIGLLVYAFLTHRGPMGNLSLLFTLPGIAVGQTILALPVVIGLTATAVESMDRKLRIAVMSMGANRRQLFCSSLWEARHGILAAMIAAYGRVMTEVGISMMVGGNIKWHTRTITTAIALETNKGQFGMGVALGLVLLTIALGFNVSLSFLRRRT